MTSKYRIVIEGKNPDYFFKKLLTRNVKIYFLEKSYNKLILVVDDDGLNKIKKIKTSYKYQILNYYGVARVKHYLRYSYLFFICFVGGVLLNIFLSNIIFSVEVIHSNNYIKELVSNDLKRYGIEKYHFKVSYKRKEAIIKEILKKENNDLEWIEIEEMGTKYVVRVEERKKNRDTEVCSKRDIVALKDAMILEIKAEEGEVVAKKYDYVHKGDIIISGNIHNKEDLMSTRCARGHVYGEIWYKVDLEIPKKYHEEIVTGREKSQLEFIFLNKHFTLFNKFKTYKREEFVILDKSILPIKISYTKYLETVVNEFQYNYNNIDDFALKKAVDKVYTKYGKDIVIQDKKVLKKEEKNSKIRVEVFIKVKEDITDFREIVNEE